MLGNQVLEAANAECALDLLDAYDEVALPQAKAHDRCDGGLWQLALLGAGACRARPHGAPGARMPEADSAADVAESLLDAIVNDELNLEFQTIVARTPRALCKRER